MIETGLMGRTVLVTGAAAGIGRATARAFAAEGAHLVLWDRNAAEGEALAEDLRRQKRRARFDAVDVASESEVNEAVERALGEFGAIDVLVNNAGITRDNLLLRMKPAEWDDVIATNLTSVFISTQAVMKPMLKQRAGSIINIGSVVGLTGNAGQANYAAAKAGLIGFSKSVAREVASRGIRVNVITPGFIDTDMTSAMPDAAKQALLANIPLGRTGAPSDIAALVVYLASEASAYVTGQTISVDGGFHM